MAKTFVLNDQTKTNSHGFRVSNAGINLDRFKANPVMLDLHWKSNRSVIGRWENIRFEGVQLLADAVFDLNDENAAEIARKVEEEFIKGCSMGLLPMREGWQLIDDVPTLTMCELTEVSIVPVPSNSNAVKLYASEGVELSADSIQLSIKELINPPNPSIMKEIKLSAATLVVLGLESTSDATAVEQAVEKLAGKLQSSETSLQVVTADRDAKDLALKTIQEQERTALVDLAVKDGKITADKREHFLKLAEQDMPLAKSILDSMQGKVSLGVTNTPGSAGAVSSVDASKINTLNDLVSLSNEQKLAFKEQHPEKFQSIVSPVK